MSYEITLDDWQPPSSVTAFDRVRLEFSQSDDPYGTWIADDVQSIAVDVSPENPDPIDITTSNFPWVEGFVRVVFLRPDDSETLPSSSIYTMVTFNGGLRGMVPRARRALEGFGPEVLTDDQIAAALADAIAEIIWYAPTWGHTLVVTARTTTNVPTDFEVTPELSLPGQTVVVAQVALSYLFSTLTTTKVTETIRDEGQEWAYTLSATAIRDRIKYLIEMRERALQVAQEELPTVWINLLYERDRQIACAVEPYYGITSG